MSKYEVGEIVSLKIKNGAVIIFEYLGRGLNGYLKLKEGDRYVELSEKYELIELFGDNTPEDKQNEYRRMVGRYIHSYGIEKVWENIEDFEYDFIHDYDSETVTMYIKDWFDDAEIPHEDFVKLFNPDTSIISEMLDKYITLPYDKKKREEIRIYTEDGLPSRVIFHE
jgi:hypothetical protein